MRKTIFDKSIITYFFIVALLLISALPVKADWCRIPASGLPNNLTKDDRIFTKTYSDTAETYVTIQGIGSFVLNGDSFRLLNKPARYPYPGKPYSLFEKSIVTNDGRVFFWKRGENNGRQMFVAQSNGAMKMLFTTSDAHLSVDKETARIFSIRNNSLYEWKTNSFQLSSIGIDADNKKSPFAWDLNYHPNYFPQLKAWVVINNGKLWLRSDKTKTWRKINKLKSGKSHGWGGGFELFHDHERKLVVLRVDMSVSVFDVSDVEPLFLYQRLIRRGSISQAGNSGILIEPIKSYKDVWPWENASITRLITHNGAQAISGTVIKDNKGRRGGLYEGSKVNPMRSVGKSVLVFHQDGVALFDGSTLHDRPDINATFPRFPPLAHQSNFGTFLNTLDQIYHWNTNEKIKPLLMQGEKGRVNITIGDSLILVRSKGKAWVYDKAQKISLLPLSEEISELESLVPISNRHAILAYSGYNFFILKKCDT